MRCYRFFGEFFDVFYCFVFLSSVLKIFFHWKAYLFIFDHVFNMLIWEELFLYEKNRKLKNLYLTFSQCFVVSNGCFSFFRFRRMCCDFESILCVCFQVFDNKAGWSSFGDHLFTFDFIIYCSAIPNLEFQITLWYSTCDGGCFPFHLYAGGFEIIDLGECDVTWLAW